MNLETIAKSILILLGLGFLCVMYVLSNVFFFGFIGTFFIALLILWCISVLVD
jgi:hypothetical protein